MSSELFNKGVQEIKDLHKTLCEWICSEQKDDAWDILINRFDKGFHLIYPSGNVDNYDGWNSLKNKLKNTNPQFKIFCKYYKCLYETNDIVAIRYVEYQEGANNSAKENTRISTVLFKVDNSAPNGLKWVSLHETNVSKDIGNNINYDVEQ